jgi:hypothetical protein
VLLIFEVQYFPDLPRNESEINVSLVFTGLLAINFSEEGPKVSEV